MKKDTERGGLWGQGPDADLSKKPVTRLVLMRHELDAQTLGLERSAFVQEHVYPGFTNSATLPEAERKEKKEKKKGKQFDFVGWSLEIGAQTLACCFFCNCKTRISLVQLSSSTK